MVRSNINLVGCKERQIYLYQNKLQVGIIPAVLPVSGIICNDGFIVNQVAVFMDTCKTYNQSSCSFPCDIRTGHCQVQAITYDVMCYEYRFSEPGPKTTPPPPPPPTHNMETGTIIGIIIGTMIGTVIVLCIGYGLRSKCGPSRPSSLVWDEMNEQTPIVRGAGYRRPTSSRGRGRGYERGRADGYESIPLVEPNMVAVAEAVNTTVEEAVGVEEAVEVVDSSIIQLQQPSPDEIGDDLVDDQHLIGYYSSVQRRLELLHL